MDYATLCTAMGRSVPVAYLEPMNNGMIAAGCTTVNRAAMWCAQVGHESMGLFYMEEIASGAAYEGRRDLGNTQPGDGRRFKGRGPIQLTGRVNYAAFSRWCAAKGYTSSPTYFVDSPTLVAQPRWGFLAAAYYWTVARPLLNAHADAGNVLQCTRDINGGTNGLADRTARWNRARPLGARLLPSPAAPFQEEDMAAVPQNEWNAVRQQVADIASRLGKYDTLDKNLRSDLDDKHKELDQIRDSVAALSAKVDGLLPALTQALKSA